MKRILALFVSFGYFLLTYSLEYHEQVYPKIRKQSQWQSQLQ